MAMLDARTRKAACVALLALLAGTIDASEWSGAPETWLPNRQMPSLIRLDNGQCFDLENLPPGWKMSSRTSRRRVDVGLPGKLGGRLVPHYKLKIITGNNYASPTDWDFYMHNFPADAPTQAAYHAKWDIPGFSAFPGSHPYIVWIGDKVDIAMECRSVGSRDFGPAYCVLHERKQPGSTYLDIYFGFDERPSALSIRQHALQLLKALNVPC